MDDECSEPCSLLYITRYVPCKTASLQSMHGLLNTDEGDGTFYVPGGYYEY